MSTTDKSRNRVLSWWGVGGKTGNAKVSANRVQAFFLWGSLCVCVLSCVQLFCSLPGSSIHGISEARILEWVAISYFILQG